MATIKATCPGCGDVDLTPRQVRVRIVETLDESLDRRTYDFDCPACSQRIEKATDADVVQLLSSAGVTITTVPLPAEAREPHEGAALGYDDLLDFALLLDSADNLAALLEPARHR